MPRRRKGLRLRHFDYATAGGYFVTICTHRRRQILGSVVDGRVVLTAVGAIARDCWRQLPRHLDGVRVDRVVVMPNHLHGILFLGRVQTPLSSVIGSFKSAVTRRVRAGALSGSGRLWQRGFYDRVIRDEAELLALRTYIETNPIAWSLDPRHAGLDG